MIIATHGIIASQLAGIVTPLLDDYPNAAAAYSLRKLRTAYTGNAIRVRRSSDNTEQDIGFSSGNLDTSALTSFCGSGNGFVTTWYDQSGNARNVTQSTASRQPQIVSSGSVILQNGKPTITHLGTTDLKLSTALDISTTHTMLGVIKMTSYNREFIGNGGSTWSYAMYNTTTTVDTEARKAVGRTTATFGLDYALFQYYRNGTTTVSIYKNNALLGGNSFNLAANNIFDFKSLSGEEYDPYNFVGNMSEVVIYTTNQSSNRTGIESNINSYYGIY